MRLLCMIFIESFDRRGTFTCPLVKAIQKVKRPAAGIIEMTGRLFRKIV